MDCLFQLKPQKFLGKYIALYGIKAQSAVLKTFIRKKTDIKIQQIDNNI